MKPGDRVIFTNEAKLCLTRDNSELRGFIVRPGADVYGKKVWFVSWNHLTMHAAARGTSETPHYETSLKVIKDMTLEDRVILYVNKELRNGAR